MAHKHLLTLPGIISLVIIGCRKDPKIEKPGPEPVDTVSPPSIVYCENEYIDESSYDTIYSCDYLAAYPGSWWEFSDGDSITCSLRKYPLTEHEWQQQPKGHYCNRYYYDTVYVPHLKGYNALGFPDGAFVYDNRFLKKVCTNYPDIPNYCKTCFFTQIDTVNQTWNSYGYSDYSSYITVNCEREIVEELETLILPNSLVFYDVLHIKESIHIYYHIGSDDYEADYYYAPEIGLIKQVVPSSVLYPIAADRYVTSYYIAPH